MNLVFEHGQVAPKEAQDLARHSTPDLTFNVYGRSRDGSLTDAVERLGEAIRPVKRVPDGSGRTTRKRNPLQNKGLRSVISGSGGRTRTYNPQFTESCTSRAESRIYRAVPDESQQVTNSNSDGKSNVARFTLWDECTSAHKKCATCVQQDPDLCQVIEAWDALPDEIKARIVKIVQASR